jgi:hypothetical protein
VSTEIADKEYAKAKARAKAEHDLVVDLATERYHVLLVEAEKKYLATIGE